MVFWARLDGDQHLVDRCGHRTGGRTERRNHADRDAHVHGLAGLISVDDAHAAQPLQLSAQIFAHETVLYVLVLPNAVIGLLCGHLRQLFGILVDLLGHAVDDRVQLLLRVSGQDFLGRLCILSQNARLLNGEQILIDNGVHCDLPVSLIMSRRLKLSRSGLRWSTV